MNRDVTLDAIRAKIEKLKEGGPLTAQRKAELAEDAESLLTRIESALGFLSATAQIDGAHHKMWTLDQAARALLACPMEEATATDSDGKPYTYERQGESAEYKKFVEDYCDGDTYSWGIGIPP